MDFYKYPGRMPQYIQLNSSYAPFGNAQNDATANTIMVTLKVKWNKKIHPRTYAPQEFSQHEVSQNDEVIMRTMVMT